MKQISVFISTEMLYYLQRIIRFLFTLVESIDIGDIALIWHLVFPPWRENWGNSAMFINTPKMSYIMCVSAQDIGAGEALFAAQLRHTPLFIPFGTTYGKCQFPPTNFPHDVKTKWRLLHLKR